MPEQSKLNTFLSTLNFVLFFVGYQLATSILLPVSSNIEGISRTVTVPYRGLALLISLFVIIINVKKREKYPLVLKVFFFYWLILIVRIFYDFHIRSDVFVNGGEKIRLWSFVFAMCLIPAYSIIKSYKCIDYNKAFKWIFGLTIFTLLLIYVSNPNLQDETTQRTGGTVGINTINYGHLAVTGIILSVFYLWKSPKSLYRYIFVAFCLVLCTVSMLKSGSRGPILALIIVISFWIFSRNKHIVRNSIILAILSGGALLFLNNIFLLIGKISPLMSARLMQEGQLDSRFFHNMSAIEAFIENPLFGKQFAIFHDNTFIYSHNIILDAFMGMGLIGGISMIFIIFKAFRNSYKFIQVNDPQFWIILILIQKIMFHMVSSAFYYSQLLSVLLVLVFLRYKNLDNDNSSCI